MNFHEYRSFFRKHALEISCFAVVPSCLDNYTKDDADETWEWIINNYEERTVNVGLGIKLVEWK